MSNRDPILEYVKGRGVNDASIDQWGFGYSGDQWDGLIKHLQSKEFSLQQIKDSGLGKEGKRGPIDVFFNRMILPLQAQDGVIGFAGRSIDNKEPKYLNSPETALYKKSDYLYGLSFAKSHIRKYNCSILTEGYLDVIMAHQADTPFTVASAGTAVTPKQIQTLANLSPNILLSFDGDAAGFRAVKKTARIALQKDMQIKVLSLPPGQDPADIIKNNPEDWRNLIKNATPLITFLLSYFDKEKKGKEQMLHTINREVMPIIALVKNPVIQSHYITEVAEFCNISKKSVEDAIELLKTEEELFEKEIVPVVTKNEKSTIPNYVHVFSFAREYLREKETSKDLQEMFDDIAHIERDGDIPKTTKELADFRFGIEAENQEDKEKFIEKTAIESGRRVARDLFARALRILSKAKDSESNPDKVANLEKKCHNINIILMRYTNNS